jgi:hypothetical protein
MTRRSCNFRTARRKGAKLRQPLSRRSVAELRAQAASYRQMATSAAPRQVALALLRLAGRFDALADQREQMTGDARLPERATSA